MEKMEIKRSDLDEVIQTSRAFFRKQVGATAIISVQNKVLGDEAHWLSSIISGITMKRTCTYDEPNETYYRVFEDLGFTIVEG